MRTQADQRLQHRCEQALAAAGRASGAGTRQQVRAAARRFVRRHRDDGGYLAFVLRGVLANSALAVALLGLAPAPVQATFFTAGASPIPVLDVGSYSAPALADLDGDGDLDLIGGGNSGSFFYFENTGNAIAAPFVQRTGAANPLAGRDVGLRSTPAFGDLDSDGDLDLVAGEYAGNLNYYENTGSRTAPSFALRTGAANPLDGHDLGYSSTPALGDLDADGDLDLVVGESYGSFSYFENTGGADAPAFVARTGSANPLADSSANYFSSPALGDFDRDGDLDLISGERYGSFFYFENTGSALAAAFRSDTEQLHPLFTRDVGLYSTPAAGDLDGDGDLDLVTGESAGAFFHHVNRARRFARPLVADPFSSLGYDANSYSALGDLDDDGDLDLVRGLLPGTFVYYENTGSATLPAYALRTGSANPLDGADGGANSVPALGDLDADGDLDLVSGDNAGSFHTFENTGSASDPAFVLSTGAANFLSGFDVGSKSTAALGDLDADGDLDFFAGELNGGFYYFENIGTQVAPVFVPRTGSSNPLEGLGPVGASLGTRLALADFDGDGDLDALAGAAAAINAYFENTGSPEAPAFVQRTGSANPFVTDPILTFQVSPAAGDVDGDGDADVCLNSTTFYENAGVRPSPRHVGPVAGPLDGKDVGLFSTPAAGDLDGDGDADFVASKGFGDGAIHYYENTGSALAAAGVERTGAANPFAAFSAGTTPHLALADLDADGDLDLASGGYGVGDPTRYFENTGTATLPSFAQRTGVANPVGNVAPGRTAPAFGDLDGDGDLDLLAGRYTGSFNYFENTGDAEAAVFVQRTGGANPLNGFSVGSFSAPALGDVDGDGDLDLVGGDEPLGQFAYFENTGNASVPAFVQRSGSANPLDGRDVGLNSSPLLVDLDGDADLDVVSGERYGTFVTYTLPEPSGTSLLAAGGALLAWLARRRTSKSL